MATTGGTHTLGSPTFHSHLSSEVKFNADDITVPTNATFNTSA